jgi:ATP-dependent helicase HrpB
VNPRELPVWQVHGALLDALRTSGRAVLTAPTGSGKSTQVPQMLLEAGLAGGGQVIVLEPRRVAARTLAARVAQERGVRLGGEVGYQVRLDDRTGAGTRLTFVTEGILVRRLQDDPELRGLGAVILDEFHERNLLSDVALGWLRGLTATRRPDLKLVVMSATLDADAVAKFLGECPVLHAEGRAFPVTLSWLPYLSSAPAPQLAAETVARIVQTGEPGDILVFMPGMGEIQATLNALRGERLPEPVLALPLHGELPPDQQDLAFAPADRRKIIVATNVAETSVTIEGVRHVVDSGLARVARYDAERGLTSLLIEPVSRASAEQRRGRAGRTAPGVCHRLWTENSHRSRPERNTPEIQRADLAEAVLLLHSLGLPRAADFPWLDAPEPEAVERAERLLALLGALEPDGTGGLKLTALGGEMQRIPAHPRFARMLAEARRRGCAEAAALCAALVGGRDLLVRAAKADPRARDARDDFAEGAASDFEALMRAWCWARDARFDLEACRSRGLHAQTAREVAATFRQFLALAGLDARRAENFEPPADSPELRKCLLAGFADQLGARRDQGTLECRLVGGGVGTLARESAAANAPLVAVGAVREVGGAGGTRTLLTLATAVEPAWLAELYPQHVRVAVEHEYDRQHRRVAALDVTRFLDLEIARRHRREPDPDGAGRCLAEAAEAGLFELPNFTHALRQFAARVNLLAAALPELDLPPFDPAARVAAFARAFRGLTLAREAQQAELGPALHSHLAAGQRDWVEELAPASVTPPGGKPQKLTYADAPRDKAGALVGPETQVKLADAFAWTGHPRVADGRVPVRVGLLAPDGKRLDVTTDWPAFRAVAYVKLRPTLRQKFPGFVWP